MLFEGRLHIQRFEEIEENKFGQPQTGNFTRIPTTQMPPTQDTGGRFFVQGSKMNTSNFDDGVDGDAPFKKLFFTN